MTADVELPPLSGELKDRIHVYVDNSFARPKLIALVQDCARACVAHATAAKDAEIEALRAEVADWKASYQQAADASLAHAERAERLADVLRDAAVALDVAGLPGNAKRFRAVLEQENDDAT